MRYLYACAIDGIIEVNVPIKDRKDEIACPKCGKPAKRQFTFPNVIYRSGGFYTTDRRLDKTEDDE